MTEVALKTMLLVRERLAYYARQDRGLSLEATQNVLNLFDAIIDNAKDALPKTTKNR
jgi:hypothetical protein